MFKNLRTSSLIFLLSILAGCTTVATDHKWPSDVPARKIFVDAFFDKRDLDSADSKILESHLVWIVRFYKGTVLYPTGWNRVSDRFLASINEPAEKERMTKRLRSLGISIANEWAQDNNIRKINSANVSVWGSALRTSAEQGDQKNYISKVEKDVEDLIKGDLTSNQINYERYYPSEDYDDF